MELGTSSLPAGKTTPSAASPASSMNVLLAMPWLPTYGMSMPSCFMFLAARAGPGLVPHTMRTSGFAPLILVSCAVRSVSSVLYDSVATISRP